MSVDGNGYLNVNVTTANYTHLDVRLKTVNSFTRTRSNLYRVTLTAKTSSGTRDLPFKYENTHPWTYMYGLGTTAETKVRTQHMSKTTENNVELEILLGYQTGTVIIEYLKIEEIIPD
jgi:hypothetical protein